MFASFGKYRKIGGVSGVCRMFVVVVRFIIFFKYDDSDYMHSLEKVPNFM
jgi:hypothetical protein